MYRHGSARGRLELSATSRRPRPMRRSGSASAAQSQPTLMLPGAVERRHVYTWGASRFGSMSALDCDSMARACDAVVGGVQKLCTAQQNAPNRVRELSQDRPFECRQMLHIASPYVRADREPPNCERRHRSSRATSLHRHIAAIDRVLLDNPSFSSQPRRAAPPGEILCHLCSVPRSQPIPVRLPASLTARQVFDVFIASCHSPPHPQLSRRCLRSPRNSPPGKRDISVHYRSPCTS